MTRALLTLTAKTRRGKQKRTAQKGRVYVGPSEIGNANRAPNEQSAVRDYVRYAGNFHVESKSERILQI